MIRLDGQPATNWQDWAPASHPPILPEPPYSGPAPACFRPPSVFVPTADLLGHRDEMGQLAHLGGFYADALAAVERALAWRASCPEHARYWEEDAGFSLVAESVGHPTVYRWVPGQEIEHARTAAQDLADTGHQVRVYWRGVEILTIHERSA